MRSTPFLFTVVIFSLMLAGCGKHSVSSVAGNYEGEYFGGVEKFTLTPDGKFTQSFTVNGKPIYTNQGSWSVQERIVTFSNFLQAYTFGDPDFARFRGPRNAVTAEIPIGTSTILFNDDGNYFVRKK